MAEGQHKINYTNIEKHGYITKGIKQNSVGEDDLWNFTVSHRWKNDVEVIL